MCLKDYQTFHKVIYTHVVDGVSFVIKEYATDYSTVEKGNEHRPVAAYRARMKLKEWDSLTCRACHKNTKPPGASAKAAQTKMQSEGATCIDCHQNLEHKKVPEHGLYAGLAQGRPVLKKVKQKYDDDEVEE